jgi:lipopolysaccharide export LptBFGC system permease protein LptF
MSTKVDPPDSEPAKAPVEKSIDLTSAYERAAHHLVPRATFPFFAAFFVLLCGAMAVMLFAVGKLFGGLLFSFVVLVGLYVAYNNIVARRGPD